MTAQISTPSPGLSSFLTAANEWLEEEYAAAVVWQVLESREHVSSEIKRALDAAIRSSGVRVPGAGFQLQDVFEAPTHHLHAPVFRKMQGSDELAEAILRAWVGIKSALYESVVQHLQWNDEPTYGPDRQERSFRGYWGAKEWQANYNQFLADRTGFDRNDVGLMLWYVSGKLPPPISEVEDPTDRVDFEKWKELLLALPSDAPQWDVALQFAAAVSEIRDEKEKQRARDAVKQLKTKLDDVWLEYSDELIYLEKNIEMWGSAANIEPAAAIQTLDRINNLESLLSQYRPIRDQAQSRSVESSRAGRRAELEAEIIFTVDELEPVLLSSGGDGLFPPVDGEYELPDESDLAAPPDLADSASSEPAEPPELAEMLELPEMSEPSELETRPAAETPPEMETLPELAADRRCEDLQAVEILTGDPEPGEARLEQPQPPEPPDLLDLSDSSNPSETDLNATILAGLLSLREDFDLLKAQLSAGNNPVGNQDARPAALDALPADLDLPEAQDAPPAGGLAAVVAQARKRFPGPLQFWLNAESWVNGNPYEDPQALSDALEWLALTYAPARRRDDGGDMDFAGLNESLYRACRWKYANRQHDQDFLQNEGHYRMLVNDKPYRLNETIGKGVGDDPVNTIRIAFYWDRQRERVVIGYIGPHRLPDAA